MVQLSESPGREGGMVRVGPVLAIPEILEELGADPATLLAEIGLELGLFDDPDNLIGFRARSQLIAHCIARTGCDHFGLLIGQRASLRSFGLVGLFAQSSPDVGTALGKFVRHFHLHAGGASISVRAEGDTAIFSYDIDEPRTPATDQVGDGAVAIMYNVMREFCGPGWEPQEARFAHRVPEDIWPFRSHFRAPLCFDAEQYALAFPARWLRHGLPETGPELHRLLRKEIDALEARYGADFRAQVRSVLRTAILTGHASEDQVASMFSIHSRTLNRRLHQCGTGFRELIEESRFELARQLLRDTALDVSQIAEMLDYAEASTFTRAFRRWSGSTPSAWRRQALARDAGRKAG
jgi:AraC-like DNA-binding protein